MTSIRKRLYSFKKSSLWKCQARAPDSFHLHSFLKTLLACRREGWPRLSTHCAFRVVYNVLPHLIFRKRMLARFSVLTVCEHCSKYLLMSPQAT